MLVLLANLNAGLLAWLGGLLDGCTWIPVNNTSTGPGVVLGGGGWYDGGGL